jgi:N-methylhydantoinase B/oxoprolinase/acetone carboxylase alpha subunit
MVEQVPRAILDYGPENLEPGDVIITNEPFPSGVHLNDISLISPVHHDGELLGYVPTSRTTSTSAAARRPRSARSGRCSRRA